MRLLVTGMTVLALAVPAAAQQPAGAAPPKPPEHSPWKANPADVGSIEAIMKATYDVISGAQGAKRDWDRMRSLFVPGARLGSVSRLPNGRTVANLGTLDDWIANAEIGFQTTGFFEREIGRRAEQYGRIAHVFSTYESLRAPTDAAPFARGINSFQLLNDGTRWWVVTIYWDQETPANPIPEKYLQKVP